MENLWDIGHQTGFPSHRPEATVRAMDTAWLIGMAVVIATAIATGFIRGR
jgi:hypothetical protein